MKPLAQGLNTFTEKFLIMSSCKTAQTVFFNVEQNDLQNYLYNNILLSLNSKSYMYIAFDSN